VILKECVFKKHTTIKLGRLLENVQMLGGRVGGPGGVQYGYVEETDSFAEVQMGIFLKERIP
jgi:hypothetical protein